MGSRKHSKALTACLGIATCTSCFPFEPTEVSAFYFVTSYNQVREQTPVGRAPWVAYNKHTKTSNFRRCPAFPPKEESRHDDASLHAASSGKYPPMSFGKNIRKKKLLVVCTDASGITATTTRCPRFRLQRRSRISSRAADEDEKFPRDFYGDNAPGRKDNAPGNTGREGHDYPLLFLPTGCRGVTPDGIYEAARKATDEI
ncbi:hypothetical protein ALC62_00494 [Cyphomyrmex costatus]|uniref:Uncharacterized protein n=1 Tax=Cyphomyrmex costatus TaxID=456900 RepID=A0A195D6I8_9HYME|nr:hypothetical protein ALC62_00494 [Cyphomyrmex costatus]